MSKMSIIRKHSEAALFVAANSFFVCILWVQNLFSWVYRGFKIFFHGYFVFPNLSLCVFSGSNMLLLFFSQGEVRGS